MRKIVVPRNGKLYDSATHVLRLSIVASCRGRKKERERKREKGRACERARTWKVADLFIYLFIQLFLHCRQFTFLFIMREKHVEIGGEN